MSTYEIEIKLPIADRDSVHAKLIQLGFQEKARIRECDMYYNSDYHDVKKLGEALGGVVEDCVNRVAYRNNEGSD